MQLGLVAPPDEGLPGQGLSGLWEIRASYRFPGGGAGQKEGSREGLDEGHQSPQDLLSISDGLRPTVFLRALRGADPDSHSNSAKYWPLTGYREDSACRKLWLCPTPFLLHKLP